MPQLVELENLIFITSLLNRGFASGSSTAPNNIMFEKDIIYQTIKVNAVT